MSLTKSDMKAVVKEVVAALAANPELTQQAVTEAKPKASTGKPKVTRVKEQPAEEPAKQADDPFLKAGDDKVQKAIGTLAHDIDLEQFATRGGNKSAWHFASCVAKAKEGPDVFIEYVSETLLDHPKTGEPSVRKLFSNQLMDAIIEAGIWEEA
jgi:hypothetical protein